MVRALASAGHVRSAAARSFTGLSFVILLSVGFWSGVLWLSQMVAHAAAGG
ncbi:hypothetical protein LJR219_003803 [Phenylobacterium sp. LjRoot219]|uniref:hypothetical protein n=1 Tax=Phenylobacterium sp. LjRoot219 TaxID=3342283 RepID=UPI003ECFFF60